MFEIGNRVRVINSFAAFFPEIYIVESVDDEDTLCFLIGIEFAFDYSNLELVV
jgi:hypothetical protein